MQDGQPESLRSSGDEQVRDGDRAMLGSLGEQALYLDGPAGDLIRQWEILKSLTLAPEVGMFSTSPGAKQNF
jgi:hypothetical protein